MADQLREGDKVRDDFRELSGGRVTALHGRLPENVVRVDVLWPSGMESRYGRGAAKEFLAVECEAFDLFGICPAANL